MVHIGFYAKAVNYTKLVPIGETASETNAKGPLGWFKVDFEEEEARKVVPGPHPALGQCFDA
jgi:hypothetical protein